MEKNEIYGGYQSLSNAELIAVSGGEFGTLLAIFSITYVIGSDLARRKK
ncbi:MAG: hypothetical protein SOS23_08010 [Streptococcus hyovaginalis]|nr:hypothetical protein [Streptococcus hyovaginalis]